VELNKSVFFLSEEEVNTIVQFLVKYFKNGDIEKGRERGCVASFVTVFGI